MDKTSTNRPDPSPLNEQLVAYLDNELDENASLTIERMMASNPTVRDQIQQLQRTWDLLDDLPRLEADERFATSTVELIASDIQAELEQQQADIPRQGRRRWLLLGLSAAVAGFLGVFIADALWPDPNQALLRDYPVVRDLDAYRQAGSVDFLRSLDEQQLFSSTETGDGP